MRPAAPAAPIAAYIGATCGICGGAIGLIGACIVAGDDRLMLELGVPALIASLAVAAACIAVFECNRRRHPAAPASPRVVIGASLLILAAFGAAVRSWVLPVLSQSPQMRDILTTTGSATSMPWWLIVAAAIAGLALLARRIVH